MFDDLVVSSANPKRTNTSWTVMISTIIQAAILGVLILIPLIYTEALPKETLTTFLVAPAPPPPKATPARIRVGGNVQAAKMVRQVMPVYPPIAKTAHISGTVVLHAVIAKDGSVEDLQYVSGPPLLMKSAMDAVKQWRYQPTQLNGDPVEVDTTISVVFTLGG